MGGASSKATLERWWPVKSVRLWWKRREGCLSSCWGCESLFIQLLYFPQILPQICVPDDLTGRIHLALHTLSHAYWRDAHRRLEDWPWREFGVTANMLWFCTSTTLFINYINQRINIDGWCISKRSCNPVSFSSYLPVLPNQFPLLYSHVSFRSSFALLLLRYLFDMICFSWFCSCPIPPFFFCLKQTSIFLF